MPATTLNQQIQALATQVGSDVKTLIAKQGDLSTLTTSQKASLVLAINELNSAISQIDMSKVSRMDKHPPIRRGQAIRS